MKLLEVNLNPTDRQLRQFGFISLFALPLLGWIWSGGNWSTAGILAVPGTVLAAAAALYPRSLKPVFIALSLACLPIGIVVGEVTMLLIYFALFAPMGIVFRLMRRDPLQRQFDRRAVSYWQTKQRPSGPASYYRQS